MIILQLRGGLGNQMFEYAFARSMSVKNNNEKIILYTGQFKYDALREFSLRHLVLSDCVQVIDQSVLIKVYRKIFYTIMKAFNLDDKNPQDALCLYRLGFFQYLGKPEYLDLKPRKLPIKYYSSVFMNNKYFERQNKLIRNELLVRTEPSVANQEWIDRINQEEESVCVHIRRGDYLDNTQYLVCDENYYINGVNYIKKSVQEAVFFVFSEDIEYAKSLELLKKDIQYVDLNNPDYEELRLMYQCKHFVISNSTFSWWAQFLSDKDGLVVAPKYWKKNDEKVSNMNSENWILL